MRSSTVVVTTSPSTCVHEPTDPQLHTYSDQGHPEWWWVTRCRLPQHLEAVMNPRVRFVPEPVVLDLPIRGRWLARNSPARRVPSHGSHLFGTTYAIDLVAVDARGRSAPWTWRTALATEEPESFVGFGAPILAPTDGVVVAAFDGEPDHAARRSQLALVPYMLGQARRARGGVAAIAGNHVVVAVDGGRHVVLLAHLQRGSVVVAVDERVRAGDQIGSCGNSGNSTQPHVHLQVTTSTDWARTRGVPLAFRRPGGHGTWVPAESEVIDVP